VMDHSGHVLAASNLAAFDSAGNAIASWRPSASGAVDTLATDGTNFYVGGSFSTIDGASRRDLALISPAGALQAWKPKATGGAVQAMTLAGTTLYVGGTFTTLDGTARTDLGAVGAVTGSLASWAPTPDNRVDALTNDGTHIYAGGFFTHVNGTSQSHFVSLSPTTGAVQTWSSHPSAAVLSLLVSGATVYMGIGGSGGKVGAYTTTGTSDWTMQTDGNVEAVLLATGELIAGGHFNNFCDPNTNCANPVIRHHIAALNLTSGALDTTWHPSVNSTLGVYSLAATSTDLYVGGDFTKIGGIDQEHYADLAITA
jgi:hypothetical protein